MTVGGIVIKEGDVLSIDGTSGKVYLGEVAVVPSPVVRVLRGLAGPGPCESDADELVKAVHRLMTHADAEAPDAGARQLRHPGGLGAGPPVRRRGHRAVPHRAHVPR